MVSAQATTDIDAFSLLIGELGDIAKSLGFIRVTSGPLVRSSYHADQQAEGVDVVGYKDK